MNTLPHDAIQFRRGTWGVSIAILIGLLGIACAQQDAEPETAEEPALAQDAMDTLTVDQVLRRDHRFSTLAAGLDSTRLDTILSGEGSFTLFAPLDTAFSALPSGTVSVLLDERHDRLRTILQHHVVNEEIRADRLPEASPIPTLSGGSVRVWVTDSTLGLGSTQVVERDLKSANGVIHVIDRVLRPPISEEN